MNEKKATQRCYKCGMCMFQCPVYSVYRNEVYSPKGKINAIDSIINSQINDMSELSEIFQECNLCRHCVNICPGEIDTPGLIVDYRAMSNKIKPNGSYQEVLTNIKQSGNPFGEKNGSNHQVISSGIRGNKEDKSRTLVFLGCTTRYKLPEITNSMLDFLDRLGFSYTILDNEPCCGNILHNIGFVDEAKNMAKKNKVVFNKFDKIITLCPGCYSMIRRYKNSVGSGFEVFHILEIIHKARSHLKTNSKEPIYFQIPCHVYNSDSRFKNIISDITRSFENLHPSIDVTQGTKCCGAGGGMLLYNKVYVQNRINILLRDVNTEDVVTACPFCYLNFRRHTSKRVSFITEKLEVAGTSQIDLKHHDNFLQDVFHKKEGEENIPMLLIKYKLHSMMKNLIK